MKVELISQSSMMRTQPVKKQMDVIVWYWSHSWKEIVVHFLSASFFNHAKAVDVACAWLDTLNQPDYKLDLGKLLSLSSVGPNVNKVVWKIIDERLKAEDLHGLLPSGIMLQSVTTCWNTYYQRSMRRIIITTEYVHAWKTRTQSPSLNL